MFLLCYN